MEQKSFHYDAFISYRHTQPDQFIAENLHKQLEAFRLPKNILKKRQEDIKNGVPLTDSTSKIKINRVFRDQEELPLVTNLEDPIVEALKNSEWLIVICSPRLKESVWCKKEIQTFIEMHGRDRVLAVLAEGEPADSFPEELLKREREINLYNGTSQTVVEEVEPLAADFRGANNKEHLAAMKSEIMRLLAPMFGLNYDELKQRHREQKMRKMISGVASAAILSLTIAIISIMTAVRINNQKNQIAEQSVQILAQADEIKAKSEEIQAQAEEISIQNDTLKVKQAVNLAEDSLRALDNDSRETAVRLAYESLTTSNGISMPETPEGYYALLKSLNPYNANSSYLPVSEINTNGIVQKILASPNRSKVVIYDQSDTLTVWDSKKEEILYSIPCPVSYFSENEFVFYDEDTALYKGEGGIYKLNIRRGTSEMFIEDSGLFNFFESLNVSAEDDLLYRADSRGIECFTYSDGQSKWTLTLPDEFKTRGKIRYYGNDTIGIFASHAKDGVSHERVFIIENGNITFDYQLVGDEEGCTIYLDENSIYVLTEDLHLSTGVQGGVDSILHCFDRKSKEVKWERSDKSIMGDKLTEIMDKEILSLVEVGKHGLIEIDAATGELLFSDFYDDTILFAGGTDTRVTIITSSPLIMHLQNQVTFGLKTNIQCNLERINIIESYSNGLMMSEQNSNRIVLYSMMSGRDLEPTDEKPESVEVEKYKSNEAVAHAEEIGLDYPAMILAITYDDNREYMCVTYNDYRGKIFKVSDLSEICSFQLPSAYKPLEEYLGTDNAGNSYWASSAFGVFFNSDYQIMGQIDYLRAINKEDNCIYLGSDSESAWYKAPIYSKDDLLRIAKERYGYTD